MNNSKTPIDLKRPMHLVFKSRLAWDHRFSLLRTNNKLYIRELILELANEYDFKILNFANVATHLHLVVRARDREKFVRFLRVFTAKIALFVLGAKKGCAKGKFWTEKLFLRAVNFGRDLSNVMFYLLNNICEGAWARRRVLEAEVLSEWRGT